MRGGRQWPPATTAICGGSAGGACVCGIPRGFSGPFSQEVPQIPLEMERFPHTYKVLCFANAEDLSAGSHELGTRVGLPLGEPLGVRSFTAWLHRSSQKAKPEERMKRGGQWMPWSHGTTVSWALCVSGTTLSLIHTNTHTHTPTPEAWELTAVRHCAQCVQTMREVPL